MLTVIAVLEAQSGKEQELEETLKSIIPKIEAEDGTLTYILHRAKDNPAQFMFYEKYTDKQALKIHSSSPHFQKMFEKAAPLLAGAPDIKIFEEIDGKK